MPATEQTWRNPKMMHVVFGITSLIMLISTLWMLAADHVREWKGYQRTGREIGQRMTQWQIAEEQSADFHRQQSELKAKLAAAKSAVPDPALYNQFQAAVVEDTQRREVDAPDFDKINRLYEELSEAGQQAKTARQTADQVQQQVAQATEQARELAAKVAAIPQGSEVDDQLTSQLRDADASVLEYQEEAKEGESEAIRYELSVSKLRGNFLSKLQSFVDNAKFREDNLARERKFKSADSDAAKAKLGLAVRDKLGQGQLDRLQAIVDGIKSGERGLDQLTAMRDQATAHRKQIQQLVAEMKVDEAAIDTQIEATRAALTGLEKSFDQRKATYFTGSPPFLGKKWLELPILDAFGSPLKIDNLWTEGLMQPVGSFRPVRRFDRCTTCHQSIEKTQPGSAVEPAFVPEHELTLSLTLSSEASDTRTLESVAGMQVADWGLVDDDDVTINQLVANGPAATAKVVADSVHGLDAGSDDGLRVGDVILYVNGDKVLSPGNLAAFLVNLAKPGETVQVRIRRGLPNPYITHPRMDLFVGPLSPHQKSKMACTVCHSGQGSATEFKFVSHSPNTPAEGKAWKKEHGWFNNHHWIYPMNPARFAESACLKCHHDVVSLAPSERFPEPPAPKVMAGYQLISDYGCYGCHEINGYATATKTQGPDMRLEPNYFAVAAAIKADPGFQNFSEEGRGFASLLAAEPYHDDVRKQLKDLVKADASAEQPQLTAYSHSLADELQDLETPGTLRKVGPTLRYAAAKLGEPFLYDWVREPKHFRPTTKMPQFFGLWDHLQSEPEQLEITKRYENIELLGIVRYLIDKSQPFDYLPLEDGAEITGDAEQLARGKTLFEVRGCLACHQHQDFPKSEAGQGPDLTGLGDKFTDAAGAKNGKAWLYSWLKSPTHYNPRTVMPNLYLDPITHADGKTTDPAADIAAYLLNSSTHWKPAADVAAAMQVDQQTLEQMVFENLSSAFYEADAQMYLSEGIPPAMAPGLKGAEIELVGSLNETKKLNYIGRKAISKYGCYGCHDIPGFEAAKPIGTGLADWGMKETSKLAFEHIVEYLHGGHGHAGSHGGAGHGDPHAQSHADQDVPHSDISAEAGHAAEGDADFDESYYEEKIEHHEREGFIWQKLAEPRSYDYHKTANKTYNERLRMPLFPFNKKQREEVVTFVLGLVAEPPDGQFVYKPNPRQEAIVQGRLVLEKFNCGGCHILEMEKWNLEYTEDDITPPPAIPDFPFVQSNYPAHVVAASTKPDPLRGVLSATVVGMPSIDNGTGEQVVLDDEGDPIDPEEEYEPETLLYRFDLWHDAILNGHVHEKGVLPLTIPATAIKSKVPGWGGDLAKILVPSVVALEKQVNPNANGTEAWGWLPPPLVGEGTKVQPEWLHSFLLEPFPIRPAVMLRMPKFNMSPDEAAKLVDYFAARDGAEYPYEFNGRTSDSYLVAKEASYEDAVGDKNRTRLDDAMKIVTDGNYCIKCHLVNDFKPAGSERALAPDLSKVHGRLRPEWIRNWIANPKRILSYTAMPVNVPYPDGVSQALYHGGSVEQVDALVDLMMNYPAFAGSKSSVTDLVEAAAASQPAAAGDDGQKEEEKSNAEGGETENAAAVTPAVGDAASTN